MPPPVEDTQRTILIVDDDPASRSILHELLSSDYEVVEAGGGEEGMRLATALQPDLILLDVQMPVLNGYKVLARLKAQQQTASIPVIFITGLDSPEDEARGLRQGVADYIAKPLSAAVVQARVSLHLRLAQDRQAWMALAQVDGLTGISNRRFFDEALAAECRRAQRSHQSVSVALIDVDFFKQFNDYYGHGMGDRALRAVAQVLRDGVRRVGDVAARYGGEEFALIMVDTTAEQAAALVEAVGFSVRALGIEHAKSAAAPVLTVSAGVAQSHNGDDCEPAALLERADRKLYQAKAAGRNCVCA